MPNSLGYAAYKHANARPAVFINENNPNVPKHVLTVVYANTGIHFFFFFQLTSYRRQDNDVNTLWKIMNSEVTQEGRVWLNNNYCSNICHFQLFVALCTFFGVQRNVK